MALKGEPSVAPNLPEVKLPRDLHRSASLHSNRCSSLLRRRPASNRCLVADQRGEEDGTLLCDHRARPHHPPDHGVVAKPRRHRVADDSLQRRPNRGDQRQQSRHHYRSLFWACRRFPSGSITGIAVTSYERLAEFKDLARRGKHCRDSLRAAGTCCSRPLAPPKLSWIR